MDTLIDNKDEWLNKSFHWKWTKTIQFIQQIEFIGLQLIDIPNSFSLIKNHIGMKKFLNKIKKAKTFVFRIFC